MTGLVVPKHAHGGAVLRLTLDAPPGNILDIAMIRALRGAIDAHGGSPSLKVIVLEGAGANFSFGASIEEHRQEKGHALRSSFHELFRALAALDRTLVAVGRGQCLGGGMELACFCQRVFAHPRTRMGQPEINLGVFPPVASVVLPLRCGQAVADEVCLSGRSFTAKEALAARLVDEVAADPGRAAERFIVKWILPKSAASLARAVRAARLRFNRAIDADLEETERIYLDDLMNTRDAREGIEAFLARRRPVWKDR